MNKLKPVRKLSRAILCPLGILLSVFVFAGCENIKEIFSPEPKAKVVNLELHFFLSSSIAETEDRSITQFIDPYVVEKDNLLIIPSDKVEIQRLDCPAEKSTYTIDEWKSRKTRWAQFIGQPPRQRIVEDWKTALDKIKIKNLNALCTEQSAGKINAARLKTSLINKQGYYVISDDPTVQERWTLGSQKPRVVKEAKDLWEDVYKTCQENKYDSMSIVIVYDRVPPPPAPPTSTITATTTAVLPTAPPLSIPTGVNYILLIDNSESVGRYLDAAKRVANYIVDHVNKEDRVAIVSLDRASGIWEKEKDKDSNRARRFIRNIKISTKDSDFGRLFDSAQKIVLSDPLSSKKPTKFIFMSDGKYEPNANLYLSGLPRNEALSQSLTLYDKLKGKITLPSNCSIYTLMIGDSPDEVIMRKIAQDNGGTFFVDSEEFKNKFTFKENKG